ncbi:MAG: electron transfer flavoprotein subunit alpha/FixB family protein [Ignisphaera sp.]
MSWKGVLIYAENYGRGISKTSFELLGKAREVVSKLGGAVSAVAIVSKSDDAEKYAKDLIMYGADKVLLYQVNENEISNPLIHKCIIIDAINYIKPKLVLFPATPWGRSLAPRVAANIRTGITADCLDIYVDDSNDIVQVRPAFTGNIIAHIKTLTNPVIATIRPGVFQIPKADSSKGGEIEKRSLDKSEGCFETSNKIKVLGIAKEKRVRLSEAEIIVSIGRGVKSKEDIKLFEDLAKELNAQLACSKPLVDTGWMERDRQVGFSGNIVKPKIYIAFGISGAPQHIAGMKDSKYVIAVNIDASAPIAKYSDLFVVGDIYYIAQNLLNVLKKLRSGETVA